MATKGFNGLAIAAVAGGGLLLYSGIAGKSFSSALQDTISGQGPVGATASNPIGQLAMPISSVVAANNANPASTPTAIGSCSTAQVQANQRLGQQLAAQAGWTGSDWTAFNQIIMMESGWCNTVKNPSSTAYGIGQFLNTTWATVGGYMTSNAQLQILWTIAYIKGRYGGPQAALTFHLQNGWY
jgi:hypothetical protein